MTAASVSDRPIEDVFLPGDRPAPAPRLGRRSGEVADRVLSRVLPDDGVAKLDVAAFTSSI